jgi:hypothetical protein
MLIMSVLNQRPDRTGITQMMLLSFSGSLGGLMQAGIVVSDLKTINDTRIQKGICGPPVTITTFL